MATTDCLRSFADTLLRELRLAGRVEDALVIDSISKDIIKVIGNIKLIPASSRPGRRHSLNDTTRSHPPRYRRKSLLSGLDGQLTSIDSIIELGKLHQRSAVNQEEQEQDGM